jgi:magnesium chelatase subunit D
VLKTTNPKIPATRSESLRVGFPFASVVGHHAAKRALLLLAIEPELRGALIASQGTFESVLARASGAFLPGTEKCCLRSASDHSRDFDADGDVVELPVNITEDRLLGGLDLERTIATGRRELSAGLLTRADRRLLYVNDINLLDSNAAAHVAHALDSRQVRLEREGMSAIHDADFSFVGIFKRDEGEPSPLLRDRLAFCVDSPADCSVEEKTQLIDRVLRFDRDPYGFRDEFAFETAELKEEVEDARARLPRVRASKGQIRQIVRISVELGVEGNRADVFALKAARANAALAGRRAINEEDLTVAVQLVLAPRATAFPSKQERPEEQSESSRPDSAEEDTQPNVEKADDMSIPGKIEDIIARMVDTRLPNDLLLPLQSTPRPSRNGKRMKARPATRGRYARSVLRRSLDARVAIDATLRASAPFQLSRREQGQSVRQPAGEAREPGGTARSRRVKIEPSDLRFKEFKHRSGILFILAVDASGSMALNRMSQVKGALTRLLQQAYLHRDQVALLSFRGERSDILLPPTRSVELAKRLVDALPAGGGTPLSAGLAKAIELARLARLRGMSQTMVVLFTDGRANVGLGARRRNGGSEIGEELKQLGALLRSEEISSVVVDTKSRFVSSGEGEALARTLGARYFYLPRSDAGAVYDAISSAAMRPSEN